MALEPSVTTLEEQANPELVDMTRRFAWSASFTLPVFVLGMGEMLPGDPLGGLVPPGSRSFIELALTAPVVLWGGAPFFRRAGVGSKIQLAGEVQSARCQVHLLQTPGRRGRSQSA
jgi:Cu+-exporting ATPase